MREEGLKKLVELRLAEAMYLHKGNYLDAAYYLAGYSVECALKAVIVKNLRESLAQITIPKKKAIQVFSQTFYEHDFENLVVAAGLKAQLHKKKADPIFRARWETVCQWSTDARYEYNPPFVLDTAQLGILGHDPTSQDRKELFEVILNHPSSARGNQLVEFFIAIYGDVTESIYTEKEGGVLPWIKAHW